jgi:hypothetical protein
MFTHYKKETAADNFLLNRVLLLLTLALLLAWVLWFFFARISLPLTNEAFIAETQTVISRFPPEIALRELQIGQVGFLRLDDLPSELYTLRLSRIGTVLLENGMIEVEFELDTESSLASGMSGQLEIEKPERSPFQLTLELLQDG